MRLAVIASVLFAACTSVPTTAQSSPTVARSATPAPAATSFAMVSGHYDVRFGPSALAVATTAKVDLVAATEGALRRIDAILPGPTPVILVDVDPALAIPETGVGGYTDPRSGMVRIALDARPASLAAMIRDWLPGSLAHELHHSRRILAGPGYGTTVGEAIVTEGLAVAFEREAFPSAPVAPWATAIDAATQHRLWPMALQAFDRSDLGGEHQHWFFGSQVDIPRWSGYTLGAEVVSAYLRAHPGSAPSLLGKTTAREIVAGSGYAP